MTQSDTKTMLLDVLQGMDLISPETRAQALEPGANDIMLGALGIDSMAVVDLCLGVEEKTGRELLVEEIIDHPTVNQLAAFLAEGHSTGA
ncbi:MAG: acyl carrier protein [Parvibaculaceae bacterium]|jgi:acyl carrier protein